MPDLHEWIDTAGGPFLLLAENSLPFWRGTEGWSTETHGEDKSDYSRACAINAWMGLIKCGTHDAYVLGGDVGPVAWITSQDVEGGYLVQWIGVDDEAQILPALQSKKCEEALLSDRAECITLTIDAPGEMKVIQAAEFGDDLVAPCLSFSLLPGNYRANSAYLETPELMIVVRKIERLT